MSETRTPKFCTVCGRQLESRSTVDGYDAYTGQPNLQNEAECTQAVVTAGRFGMAKTSFETHNRWVNEAGSWSRAV